MRSYVIESDTRGLYIGHDYNEAGDRVPKWRWSISRAHPDVMHFWTPEAANARLREVQVRVPNAHVFELRI